MKSTSRKLWRGFSYGIFNFRKGAGRRKKPIIAHFDVSGSTERPSVVNDLATNNHSGLMYTILFSYSLATQIS